MANNRYSKLVREHQWQLLMDVLPREETVLSFSDANSLESFRVRVNQVNAYGRKFNMSVRRKEMKITISRVCL